MKKSLKIIMSLSLVLIIMILIAARIYYVNNVEYSSERPLTYSLDEAFEYNELEFKITNRKILSPDQLMEEFPEIPEDVLKEDGGDLLLDIHIKNTSGIEQDFDLTALTMQIGIFSGGGINPYLFQYMNTDLSAYLTIKSNQEISATLAYPMDTTRTETDDLKLILYLYPQTVSVGL